MRSCTTPRTTGVTVSRRWTRRDAAARRSGCIRAENRAADGKDLVSYPSRRLKRFGPQLCLRHKLTTSGRRWEKHGVLRTILLMWRLRLAYWLGADPHKLAVRYDRS